MVSGRFGKTLKEFTFIDDPKSVDELQVGRESGRTIVRAKAGLTKSKSRSAESQEMIAKECRISLFYFETVAPIASD